MPGETPPVWMRTFPLPAAALRKVPVELAPVDAARPGEED
jgi:hypothetical protein